MVFAKLLKLRDKMTSKRKKLSFEDEKPFLEHLEDLRKTLTRVVVTLLVAMTVSMIWCFEIMEMVKWPAKAAGLDLAIDPGKPEQFDHERWERTKELARTASSLMPDHRAAYFSVVGETQPEQRHYAEALLVYHAGWTFAKTKNEKGEERKLTAEEIAQRDKFFAALAIQDKDVKAALDKMISKGTQPDLQPAKPAIDLVWRKPMEAFFTSMKLSLYAGVIFSFPLLLYFLLQFILPGMTPKERKALWPAMAIGFGLFLTGVAFAFFWVVPRTLVFGHSWGNAVEGTKNLWEVGPYVSFVTMFSLVFGLAFELPVVVLTLVKLDLLSSDFMRRTRSWAVIIIVVISAVITPTGDPGTLAALAVPMILMYEACIWIARGLEKKKRLREEEEEREQARRRARLAEERAALPAPVEGAPAEEGDGHPTDSPSGDTSRLSHHEDEYHRQHDDHPEDLIHDPDHDHDVWLKEQEEIYRREHPHLFEPSPAVDIASETVSELISPSEAVAELPASEEPPKLDAVPEETAPLPEKSDDDKPKPDGAV